MNCSKSQSDQTRDRNHIASGERTHVAILQTRSSGKHHLSMKLTPRGSAGADDPIFCPWLAPTQNEDRRPRNMRSSLKVTLGTWQTSGHRGLVIGRSPAFQMMRSHRAAGLARSRTLPIREIGRYPVFRRGACLSECPELAVFYLRSQGEWPAEGFSRPACHWRIVAQTVHTDSLRQSHLCMLSSPANQQR